MTEWGIIPEWRFHPHESAFPMDVNYLLTFATFISSNEAVSMESAKAETNTDIQWSIPKDVCDTRSMKYMAPPVYAHKFECVWNGIQCWATQFVVAYAENPGSYLMQCMCLPFCRIGKHGGDFETVVLLYEDVKRQELYGMFTFAHGMASEAVFTPVKDLQMNLEGQPVVWVALGSHAHIPKEQSRWRFVITSDNVSSDGIHWKPREVIALESEWWMTGIRGRWGDRTNGPYSPGLLSNTIYEEWQQKQLVDKTKSCVCFL